MILISGGAGVMGSRLTKGLADRGEKVRVLTLPGDPFVSRLEGVPCEIKYGDVSDASSLKGVFDGIRTVYHLAAIIIARDPSLYEKINVQGTRNMVEGAAAAGARHFIFVSSASVAAQATPYSLSKVESERIVKEQTSMAWTIVRPTLAYEKDGGQEFMMFLDYLKKYPVVPFIGSGKALKNPVDVADLMLGFLALCGNEKTHGKIYNFSGGEEITLREFARLLLKHQGLRKPIFPIPIWICRILAFAMEKVMQNPPMKRHMITDVTRDANLDHGPATADLGYRPIGIREGLQKYFPL